MWDCYLIRSLDSNKTYIGATNNFEKRLNAHNFSKRGAKYTRGEIWVPVILIKNFVSKRACLSFEYQWKRLSRKRVNKRLEFIEILTDIAIKYTKNTIVNRILDLLHLIYFHTFFSNKYTIDFPSRNPIIYQEIIIKKYCSDLNFNYPFPYFVKII